MSTLFDDTVIAATEMLESFSTITECRISSQNTVIFFFSLIILNVLFDLHFVFVL